MGWLDYSYGGFNVNWRCSPPSLESMLRGRLRSRRSLYNIEYNTRYLSKFDQDPYCKEHDQDIHQRTV